MKRKLLAACVLSGILFAGCSQETGPIRQAVQNAAKQYNVPERILLAVGYVESRWQTPEEDDHQHIAPAVGITRLRVGDTLDLAARLTGYSLEDLSSDLAANIEGLAAVLHFYGEETGAKPHNLASWRPALEKLSGAQDPTVAAEYASQIFATIEKGAVLEGEGGERIVISAARTEDRGGIASLQQALGYPNANWVPAHSSNYSVGRNGGQVKYIIIHTTQGSYSGTISWFQNASSNVSAHYVIRSSDGKITQMVDENNTAWHGGNSYYNRNSIGIEHEGFVEAPNTWYTDAMYVESAKLVRYLADKYGVPIDRNHIIGHYQIPSSGSGAPCSPSNSVSTCVNGPYGGASHHSDPGSGWDWDRFITLVKNNGQTIPPYRAKFVSADYPTEMVSGEEAVVRVEFENTGAATWDLNLTRLGTISPQDRNSLFFVEDNWISPSRPTAADHSNYATGAIGRFSFLIRAPEVTEETTFVEHFRLVQEGVTWFNEEASAALTITVRPTSLEPGEDPGSGEDPNLDPEESEHTPGTLTGACAVGAPSQTAGSTLLLFFALLGFALLRRR